MFDPAENTGDELSLARAELKAVTALAVTAQEEARLLRLAVASNATAGGDAAAQSTARAEAEAEAARAKEAEEEAAAAKAASEARTADVAKAQAEAREAVAALQAALQMNAKLQEQLKGGHAQNATGKATPSLGAPLSAATGELPVVRADEPSAATAAADPPAEGPGELPAATAAAKTSSDAVEAQAVEHETEDVAESPDVEQPALQTVGAQPGNDRAAEAAASAADANASAASASTPTAKAKAATKKRQKTS